MNVPEGVEVVKLAHNDFQLLGAAAVLLIIFVVGFWFDITRLQLLAIFGCLTVQGMRK